MLWKGGDEDDSHQLVTSITLDHNDNQAQIYDQGTDLDEHGFSILNDMTIFLSNLYSARYLDIFTQTFPR